MHLSAGQWEATAREALVPFVPMHGLSPPRHEVNVIFMCTVATLYIYMGCLLAVTTLKSKRSVGSLQSLCLFQPRQSGNY